MTSDFLPEPPTAQVPRTQSQRSAKLTADWRNCEPIPEYQSTIERIASKLAALAKAGRGQGGGGVRGAVLGGPWSALLRGLSLRARGVAGAQVKPLTAAEVRAAVARLPEEFRDQALRLLSSAWDEGASAGLARMPRSSNPFLVQAATTKAKGKTR